jgi:hypothetical protein
MAACDQASRKGSLRLPYYAKTFVHELFFPLLPFSSELTVLPALRDPTKSTVDAKWVTILSPLIVAIETSLKNLAVPAAPATLNNAVVALCATAGHIPICPGVCDGWIFVEPCIFINVAILDAVDHSSPEGA